MNWPMILNDVKYKPNICGSNRDWFLENPKIKLCLILADLILQAERSQKEMIKEVMTCNKEVNVVVPKLFLRKACSQVLTNKELYKFW